MASTNKTTNYELSQYIGSDKPTYLGDYNSDMLKIDAGMKANADLFEKFNLNPTQYSYNSASMSYVGCSGVEGYITVAKDSSNSIFKVYGALTIDVDTPGIVSFSIANAITNDTQYTIDCAGLWRVGYSGAYGDMVKLYVNADNSITVHLYTTETGIYRINMIPCVYFNKDFGDQA